tara:strand:- start:286 stop:741 length:456 start_codon:yes stop_codon:yes gene_type:complete
MSIRNLVENNGLVLPQAPMPVGNYVATLNAGNLLFISGQLPIINGELVYTGQLGKELTTQLGKMAAELCALNLLSQIENSLGTRKLKSVVKIEGYINARESFTDHAEVLNGASDLISTILTDKSGHIRTVVGCTSLPMNAAVEISAIVELE